MFTFRKPSVDALRRILARSSRHSICTYARGGGDVWEASMPDGYVVDHTRVELGRGQVAFERAKRAIKLAGSNFNLAGLRLSTRYADSRR